MKTKKLDTRLESFDIAVTTDSSNVAKGSISLKVAGFGFDGERRGANRNTAISRLKFEMPQMLTHSSDNER